MDWLLPIFKKYELFSLLILSVILTVAFITAAFEMGNLLQQQIWRLFTYVIL